MNVQRVKRLLKKALKELSQPIAAPPPVEGVLDEADAEALARFLRLTAVALRVERDGYYADWRDETGPHHTGPYSSVSGAVDQLVASRG